MTRCVGPVIARVPICSSSGDDLRKTEEELQLVVSDLVRSKVDLMVTIGSPAARSALQSVWCHRQFPVVAERYYEGLLLVWPPLS